MKQNRFRSRVVWASIVAQIIVIVGLAGGWDAIGVTSDTFQGIATAILEILTLFGILNNPTDSTKF